MTATRILHYPGSKWSMADWIISYMPSHATYLEPYFGSGAVFFNKQPSALETINDLDGDVVNLFRIIRDRPDELSHLVRWTPYSREEYYNSYQTCGELNELERARRFLIRCWMARGAKTSDRTGWRHIIDHNGPRPVRQWNEVPEKIIEVTDRLKGVQLEQQPAVKLIERHNRDDVLVYADPPYLLSTRSKRMYRNEMNNDDHEQLLDVLLAHSGPVLLSGYAHQMYDDRLRNWRRETKEVSAEAGKSRTEVLWINPIAAEYAGRQLTLF